MVADVEIVRDRMIRIARYVKELREFGTISFESFEANRERQYAVLLGKKGILGQELTGKLRSMARFRNRMILQTRLDDFTEYLKAIESYLSRPASGA